MLWFAGLLGLVVAAAVASGRGRATPNDVAGRGVIATAALAYVVLVASAVWRWGGGAAREGRIERMREGASVAVEVSARVPLERATTIGHGAKASLHVPGTGADELAQITVDGAGVATVKASAPSAVVAAVRTGEVPEAVAKARGCTPDRVGYTLPRGAAVVVIECDATTPVRAIIVRRDRVRDELVVTPLAWKGRFVVERRMLRAGDAVRLGGIDDAIPALVTWDVVGPAETAAMLAIPIEPSDCTAWSPEPGASLVIDHGCQVTAGAYVVTAVPFIPDADAVIARGAWAAFAIGAPPLLLLGALVLAPRRGRRARAVGRALRTCVLGVGLVALAGWRLLWAYRIDVMREGGTRVADNLLAVVAIGATLAGLAVLALDALEGRSLVRRLATAMIAWAAWLAVGAYLLDLTPRATPTTAGVLGLSLVAALVPLWRDLTGWIARRLTPELVLVAIASAAVVARMAHTRGALEKLGLAYATVLAGHAALRTLLVAETSWLRRAWLAGSLAAAAGSLAMFDAGVTLAIVGVGLALAMIVAGHDALYDASHAGKIGLLEREHARLLVVHGAATIALALAVATCAVRATDRGLLAYGVLGVLHAPLVAAGLFGLAAIVARSHRRSWAPWLAAALAALAVWGMRDALIERVTAGDGVASRRVSAVVEPGYALLRDDRAFVANASAWREAALAPTSEASRWDGQGYFGARIRDPGVVHSIDNDYLPVLVAREQGIAGLLQGVTLLLVIAVGAGAIASVRLRHASREHRARWLVCGVAGALALYQPLAALGVLPLTGISWPGLGIDSPGDLWLFVIGAAWALLGGDGATDDERVRQTPRLARARRIAIAAFAIAGLAAMIVVARAGACALARATDDDARVSAALRYAATIGCPAPERAGDELDAALPVLCGGTPTDDATTRFDAELRIRWNAERTQLVRALAPPRQKAAAIASPADRRRWANDDPPADRRTRKRKAAPRTTEPDVPIAPIDEARIRELFALSAEPAADAEPAPPPMRCPDRAGSWRLVRDGDACIATLSVGWPQIRVTLRPDGTAIRATATVELPDGAVSSLRVASRPPRPRVRVVSVPIGIAADDVGELALGARIIRLRAGAPALDVAALAPGVHVAGKLVLASDVTLEVRATPRGVVLHGPAELFVADAGEAPAWRRTMHAAEVVLDRITLVAAGPPNRRAIALFRPPRAWAGSPAVVDSLLADTAGDREHRIYPHGPALPELGWVNPFSIERSLGLDGWVHAALAEPGKSPVACGTLTPPTIARESICSPSPLDGVTECRVTLQPQLALSLRALGESVLANPERYTGRTTAPVRVGYVVLRGDTGELLAQGNLAQGRPALAYAPTTADAEARLVALRDQKGETYAERVEWNLPIAVGSTFKPIVARAAEQAFPREAAALNLSAGGHADGCKARRGKSIDPIMGHCPPTSVEGNPTTADLHDFLQRSPNWYMAALGLLGLGLPDAQLAVKDQRVTFQDVVASDLASWPADAPLTIDDASGIVLGKRSVSIDGMRRSALWKRIEALLGRPVCTLGNRTRCERAATRADLCAARGLPIASPSSDLKNLVALGPDALDPYPDDRPAQTSIPIREYFQLLRGSGVHPIGSLAQITDAFGRVIYDSKSDAPKLAASWFPAPKTGTLPDWSCANATGHAPAVLGADGGLCGVVQPNGTAHAPLAELLADPNLVIYGAKTGTIDSLADIARSAKACRAWNASHVAAAQLECGKAPLDDSLFVIAFGVVTPRGTIPITLGIQLQRAGKSAASKAAPVYMRAIASYLRGQSTM
ncbi:MAG TPA: hypothetical protein VFQ53_14615 [Kofleriaceae bacterium]|nr:hypothetical protein [Kofleriaceae bacterium]